MVVDSVRITPEGVSIKFKLVGAPGKKEVVQFESLKERAAGGSKEYGEHATWDYPNGFSDGWSTGSGRPTNTSRQTYYFADPRDRDRLFPVMVKDKAGHFLYSLDVTFTDKGDIYVNRQHVTSPSWYAP